MIIWSGWGILVLIITGVNTFIMIGLIETITKDPNLYENSSWPFTVVLIVSGIMCWFLGKKLNKPSTRIFIDKETGEEFREPKRKHRLFFIKMEYWAPILVIIGLINLFEKL